MVVRTNGLVLVSGASVAGPVLAYWLRHHGFTPVVVERTPAHRHGIGGHAVDLFGPAVHVMARMGLASSVRDARTRNDVVVLERPGRPSLEIDVSTLTAGISDDGHVEIMRGELARILHDVTREDVEYVFGDSIAALEEADDGVLVTFGHGAARRFDLVVGADGMHSGVRALAFGPEERFRHFLGGYLATFSVPDHRRLDGRVVTFSVPNRLVALYPIRQTGRARVVMLFRQPEELQHDHRDVGRQQELVRAAFRDVDWEVPRLLAELGGADDFYFDSISQIRMDSWTMGRAALVGDAGYAPGPAVGGGTTVAAVGAYILAEELARAGGEHRAAFAAYEDRIRTYVLGSRRVGPTVMRSIIPRSRFEVTRNAWATRLLPRLPVPVRRRLLAFDARLREGLTAIDLDRPDATPRS